MPHQPWLFLLSTIALITSLVLGGGTHAGFLGDVVIQAAALPLAGYVVWCLFGRPWKGAEKTPFGAAIFTVLLLALPLLQLLPIAPQIPWLPSAHLSPDDTSALNSGLNGWQSLSVYPEATWLAWLSLIPAVALFWGIALLNSRDRRLVSVTVIAIGVASVLLGFLQISQGPSSELRFFEVTNQSEAVGFFANRNHFAALLYCEILIVAAWIIALTSEMLTAPRGRRFQSAAILVVAAAFAFLVALVAAQGMARSRAGTLLAGVALAGAIAMTLGSHRQEGKEFTPRWLIGAATVIAMTLLVEFSLYRAFERFAYDSLQDDSRIVFGRNTIEAAKSFMPFGSGLGTFVRVYGLFEKPADAMINKYANHAHNDWLELWLEMGAAGLVLAALFVIWLILRARNIWLSSDTTAADIDRLLAKSASLIVFLILLHSGVDYPLRTAAIMAMMAYACGLLIEPPPALDRIAATSATRQRSERRSQHSRHQTPARSNDSGQDSDEAAPAGGGASGGDDAPRRPVSGYDTQSWGNSADWPTAWVPAGPSQAQPEEPTVLPGPAWPSDKPALPEPGSTKK